MTSDTSPRPIISPLRARMIEDMSVRGFKEDTRRDYVRHVRAFAAFIGRSPDTATAEELRPFTTNIDPGDAAPAERRPSAPVFALDILAPAAARHCSRSAGREFSLHPRGRRRVAVCRGGAKRRSRYRRPITPPRRCLLRAISLASSGGRSFPSVSSSTPHQLFELARNRQPPP